MDMNGGNNINNKNNEDDIEINEINDNNKNDISFEEVEEEDNDYFDDNLVSNEDLENLGKFDFEVVRDGGMDIDNMDNMDQNMENMDNMDNMENMDNIVEENFNKEFPNFRSDGEIYTIAVNEKGIAVIGDGEDTITFFDLGKKEVLKKEKVNKDSVVKVSFSNDGKYLAAGSLDGTVNIFETNEYKIVNTMNGSCSGLNVST